MEVALEMEEVRMDEDVMLNAGAVEPDVMDVAAADKAPVWVVDPVEMALITTLEEERIFSGNKVGKNETYSARAECLGSTCSRGEVGANAGLLGTACDAVDEDLASARCRLLPSRRVVEAKHVFGQAGGAGQYYGKSSVAIWNNVPGMLWPLMGMGTKPSGI